MSEELLNILSNSNKDIDNQKLMDYISNKVSEEDRHEIEKSILDSAFMADAVEGLKAISDKEKLEVINNKINSDIKNHLKIKTQKRTKKILLDPSLVLYAIVLILLLVIVAYIIIRKHLGV